MRNKSNELYWCKPSIHLSNQSMFEWNDISDIVWHSWHLSVFVHAFQLNFNFGLLCFGLFSIIESSCETQSNRFDGELSANVQINCYRPHARLLQNTWFKPQVTTPQHIIFPQLWPHSKDAWVRLGSRQNTIHVKCETRPLNIAWEWWEIKCNKPIHELSFQFRFIWFVHIDCELCAVCVWVRNFRHGLMFRASQIIVRCCYWK